MNAPAKPTQLEVYRAELLPTAKADELYQALPSHIKPAVFERNLLNAMMANPDLMKFAPALVYREVAKAAGLGLLLDPLLGEGYLVPAYNYKTKSVEPQLRVGYKGMCKLARHTGDVGNIYAHEIHERDHVEADLGYPKVFHHRPKLFSDRGDIVGYVAIITFKDGTFDFEPMSVEQCHDIRDRSDAWKAFVEKKIKSTPWSTDDSEMSKKTALRRLLKRQAQSPELVAAIRIEDEADFPDINRANVAIGPRDAAPPRNAASAPKVIEHQPVEQVETAAASATSESGVGMEQPANESAPEPRELIPEPGKTNSYEGWALAYIALIETSPDKGTLLKWGDANLKRLEKLKGSPEWSAKVTSAVKAKYASLHNGDPISTGRPAEAQDEFPGDTPMDGAETAKAAPAKRTRASKAPDFSKDYDGWLAWQLKLVAAAETPERIEEIYEALDPLWSDIMEPDRETLMGARREAESKLEQ